MEPSLSFSSIPSQIPQEYLTITEIKNTTVLAENTQNQLIALPLSNINLYNRPIKPDEIQPGDVLVIKSINSIKIIELYLESAEILSVDSSSIYILLQGKQSYKLNRKQLGNYTEDINAGEIVRVFKRKDEILKIIFKSQFIVNLLNYDSAAGQYYSGNIVDRRGEESKIMSGSRIGLKIEDKIEKDLDRVFDGLSLDCEKDYDIIPTRGPEQILSQDELSYYRPSYRPNQVQNMEKVPVNNSPYNHIQQPQPSHELPIDPKINPILQAQSQSLLSSPIQPRIPGSPYSSPPTSTQIPQSIPPIPIQPPYSPYTQTHQPIAPNQPRIPGYSYNYPINKDPDNKTQTIPAPNMQYPDYNQYPSNQMHQYGMSSYQGQGNRYTDPQVHQYQKQPAANQHTYYAQGPQYSKPPQDFLNHYSPKDSIYPQHTQTSQYPSQLQTSQYPSQLQGSQYPSQLQGSQYPSQLQGSQYPSPPQGSQYPSQLQGSQYPSPPQVSQYPAQLQGSQYPSPPQGSQYPAQLQGSQYPYQPRGSQYPSQPEELKYSSQPKGPQYPSQLQDTPYPYQPEQPQYPNHPQHPHHSPSYSSQILQPSIPKLPPHPYQQDHSDYSMPKISSPILQSPIPSPSQLPIIPPHPFNQDPFSSSSEQPSHSSRIRHMSSSNKPRNLDSRQTQKPSSRSIHQPNPPSSSSRSKIYSLSPKKPVSTLSETNSEQALRKRQNFTSFNSYREMNYSADSYYLALGIGYLEHLCRNSTDSSMIYIFINYLKDQIRQFKHRKILCNSAEFIRALENLASSRDRFPMLKILLENSDFLKDYAKILRFLTANIMEIQGSDSNLLRQVDLEGPISDSTLRYLADALNILVIFHSLNPSKLFQKGAVNYDLVIHLISKQEEGGTWYSLLYFSYQDEEDMGTRADDKQFRCMGCYALPHELHFPQGRHKCCCVCSGKQVLKSNEICSICRVPFKPSLKNYLLGTLYTCQECGASDYLQNLRVCGRSDRILCGSCIDKVTYSSSASYNTSHSRDTPQQERPARILQDTLGCIYCERSLPSTDFTDKLSCDCICCKVCYQNLKDSGLQACIFCNTPLDPNSSNCILCNKIFPKQQEIALECKHTYCPRCAEKTFGSQLETLSPTILCGACKAPVAEEKYANIVGQALLSFYKQQIRYQKPCRLCSHDISQDYVELSCGHAFDKDCLEACFMDRIDRNEELRCPEMCSKEIDCNELKQVLSREYIGRLVGKEYRNLSVKNFTKCPKCNTKYSKDKVAGNVNCRVCKLKYCGECDMPQQVNGNNHAQNCLFY